jgi:hypothetical protein
MKISAILKTSQFRGDHDADISMVFDVSLEDTVQQLIERVNLRYRSEDLILKVVEEDV